MRHPDQSGAGWLNTRFLIPVCFVLSVIPVLAQNKPLKIQDNQLPDGQAAFNEGDSLLKHDTAEFRRAALLKYQEAAAAWHRAKEVKREVEALARIALTYYRLDEYPKSLEYYTQSLNLALTCGDHVQEGRALNGIGNAYWATGDYGKALDAYQRSLELSRATGNRSGEAYTLGNIGAVYWARGEGGKAFENYNRALVIMQDLGDQGGQAFILYNIGLRHAARSESEEAFKNYELALQLQRAIGDNRAEATTLNNIGLVYAYLGERERALEYYNRALSLRRAGGYRPGLALTLRNIGDIYASQSEYDKALKYYAEAVPLSEAVGDRRGLAYTLDSIGIVHLQTKDFTKALASFEKAITLFRQISHKIGEASTLTDIGSNYASLGQPERALEIYDQALSLFHDLENRLGEARVLYQSAGLEQDRGNLSRAKTKIEKALEIADRLRSNVATADLRASFFATVQDYYDLEISVLMAMHKLDASQHYDSLALHASERARARSLIETLEESRVVIQEGVDRKLVQQESSLAQRLDEKANYRTELLSTKPNSDELAGLQKEIDELNKARESVLTTLKGSSPHYSALAQPQPLFLKEIQEQILDSNTLLLEYALGNERSFLWVVTSSSMNSFELPRRSEIESVARTLNDSLRARNIRPDGETPELRAKRLALADTQYLQAAQVLSHMLLGPVIKELGKKRLLIVAEGALQYVPFTALPAPVNEGPPTGARKGDSEPLVLNHEIINLPSASTLAVLRREARMSPNSTRTLFVFGDPVFEQTDARLRSPAAKCANNDVLGRPKSGGAFNNISPEKETPVPSDYEPMRRLVFSCEEALNILSLLPPSQRSQAVDFNADRALAMSDELRGYRIVHFATHARIDTVHPQLSRVVLSRLSENGQWKDGSLTLSDIYNLRLSAELVVLSGCETALGKQIRGEGIIGLTRGFMYAGSPRVVASLWRVDDRATSELMKIFYEGMFKKDLSPATALKEAQVAVSRKRNWAHPYYWAAFVIQGEPNKMSP